MYFHWLGRDADPLKFPVKWWTGDKLINFEPNLTITSGYELNINQEISDNKVIVTGVFLKKVEDRQ